jgi:hypothetical protein
MTNKHLTDEELQQYALDSSACDATIAAHILLCEDCKARSENYELLFTAIKQQPEPVFDFNLPNLVLAQLPKPKPGLFPKGFFTYLLIMVSIILPVIVLYVFRKYWFDFFNDIATYTVLLIIMSFAALMVALCIDTFRSYQKKMNSLNYS